MHLSSKIYDVHFIIIMIMLQRLDSYYKRNYKDYFEFVEGASKGNQEQLSEAEKGIIDWLQKNK